MSPDSVRIEREATPLLTSPLLGGRNTFPSPWQGEG